MTQEDKDLLLKDLCARLPYGVKVSIKNSKNHSPITVCEVTREYICVEGGGEKYFPHGTYQSYLRPMSSMTDEERNELSHYDNSVQRTDFFYSHHIDCRFMIEKGLALKAPEGMY